jgi:hypothetical protein
MNNRGACAIRKQYGHIVERNRQLLNANSHNDRDIVVIVEYRICRAERARNDKL